MRYVELLDEKCWKGYQKKGTKMLFGKRVPNCIKKESKEYELYLKLSENSVQQLEEGIADSLKKLPKNRTEDPVTSYY